MSRLWAVLGAVLFLDLGFVRASFCASACPYAKLQGVLFDASTLVVAYDARRDDECIDRGVILMCYNPVIRINPPLVITEQEAAEGIDVLIESIGVIAKSL